MSRGRGDCRLGRPSTEVNPSDIGTSRGGHHRYDRRQYVGDALRSAIAAGADEVVLVRNFDYPIPGVDLQGVTDLLETDPRIGIEQARGLRSVTSEVVAFLDDDDVWLPEKVGALRTWFERPIVYACHFQVPIDAEGRPVTSSHPEWADKDPSQLRRFSTATFRTKHNTLWPGNCSSTAIRRVPGDSIGFPGSNAPAGPPHLLVRGGDPAGKESGSTPPVSLACDSIRRTCPKPAGRMRSRSESDIAVMSQRFAQGLRR